MKKSPNIISPVVRIYLNFIRNITQINTHNAAIILSQAALHEDNTNAIDIIAKDIITQIFLCFLILGIKIYAILSMR